MEKKKKKNMFPNRRLKKRVVEVVISGNLRLPVVAKKLGLPLKEVRAWKRKFKGQVKRLQLPGKKARLHIDLIHAIIQRARAHSRVIKLRAALGKA